MAKKHARARKTVQPRARRRPAAAAARSRRTGKPAGGSSILAWDDDPLTSEGAAPARRAQPSLTGRLAVSISTPAPAASEYALGTREFRHWVAADALARTAAFWSAIVPPSARWHTGATLPVQLDAGVDLNAYYNRAGLLFFHKTIGGKTVYSGESPDVLAHEMGHAVLDAIRPQLWDANTAEAAAFHESFGDISAILSAMQLESMRKAVLRDTAGQLYRTSRLSRIAEQLGWGIRQQRPESVDADCLRNAVNSFFYRDPVTLPPTGPATSLSSSPHSFSRVFTGAFFEGLSGMLGRDWSEDDLLSVSQNAGRLIVDAAIAAPIVPAYFSQVAAHVVAADARRFGGRNRDALTAAFVRHGVLSLETAVGLRSGTRTQKRAPARRGLSIAADADEVRAIQDVPFAGERYGLGNRQLCVSGPVEAKRFAAAPAALDVGSLEPQSAEQSVQSYLEDLFRRGRIDVSRVDRKGSSMNHPFSKKTHEIVPRGNQLVLERRCFDCGFDGGE